MKKRIAILIFTFMCAIGCTSNHADSKESNNENSDLAMLQRIQILLNLNAYHLSPCLEYSMPVNIFYLTEWYYQRFNADQTQYKNIIVGDSSMDYSSRYPGFMGPHTQSVAVQGNTVCDMVTQIPAINTTSPEAIIVGTMGGNDILHGIVLAHISQSHRELFSYLKVKFPSTKIVALGIPPTSSNLMNSLKGQINASAFSTLQSIYPPGQFCFLDPAAVIGEPPVVGTLIDTIHYSPFGAGLVKGLVFNVCGVDF